MHVPYQWNIRVVLSSVIECVVPFGPPTSSLFDTSKTTASFDIVPYQTDDYKTFASPPPVPVLKGPMGTGFANGTKAFILEGKLHSGAGMKDAGVVNLNFLDDSDRAVLRLKLDFVNLKMNLTSDYVVSRDHE